MITVTLRLGAGHDLSYELGQRKVPPTYIIHQGDLYAAQPWDLPGGGADIAVGYARISSLDVTQWLPVQKRAAA